MWSYLQRKLGIQRLIVTNALAIQRIRVLQGEVDELRAAMFDETHPLRQAASNAIGERQIERLKAEDKARKHTLGEL